MGHLCLAQQSRWVENRQDRDGSTEIIEYDGLFIIETQEKIN